MYAFLLFLCGAADLDYSPPAPPPLPIDLPQTSDYLKAAAMLESPADVVYSFSSEELPRLLPALRQICLERELMDPREQTFKYAINLASDLSSMKDYAIRLRHAPMVMDGARFPSKSECAERERFAGEYISKMKERLRWEQDNERLIRQAISEAEELKAIWCNAQYANDSSWYVTSKRHHLQMLKKLIGDEMFEKGEMPDCVPTWRFYEVR